MSAAHSSGGHQIWYGEAATDAQDIAGKNLANPTAMLLSSTMLLRHLGLDTQANLIASSVYDVVKEGKHRTADLGGKFPY